MVTEARVDLLDPVPSTYVPVKINIYWNFDTIKFLSHFIHF